MVELEPDRCTICGGCVAVCPGDSITVYEAWVDTYNKEYTNCGVQFKASEVAYNSKKT